jgi:pyridoxamine 5'-phosphate oxidase
VLLKGADSRGFVFFTNTQSRKGAELAVNPRAALALTWHAVQRQVRVEGPVQRLSAAEDEAYFASRPHASRLGTLASPQSHVVPDRQWLEDRYVELERTYPDGSPVPRPPHWGGYRVVPERIEFWQGRRGRLHDRLLYVREDEGWRRLRLAP